MPRGPTCPREARSLQTCEANFCTSHGRHAPGVLPAYGVAIMISLGSPLATSAGPMPGALRDLALDIGDHPLAGLTAGAVGHLVSACHAFATLIEAEPGADARFGPCFLMSVLSSLRGREGEPPLSDQDEAWMVSEVESELGEARARMDARTGRPWSPRAARPLFPVREGGNA